MIFVLCLSRVANHKTETEGENIEKTPKIVT